ncbi:unnamed protein product [Amoebophrya sp. A120]|nr:unnamed protein product [Amoebophrya sp. A120]|eukprot:GSA120T00006292001.1
MATVTNMSERGTPEASQNSSLFTSSAAASSSASLQLNSEQEQLLVRALGRSKLKRGRSHHCYLKYCFVFLLFCFAIFAWHGAKLVIFFPQSFPPSTNPNDPDGRDAHSSGIFWIRDLLHYLQHHRNFFFGPQTAWKELLVEELIEIFVSLLFILETLLVFLLCAQASFSLYFALDPPHTRRDFFIACCCFLSILYGVSVLHNFDAGTAEVVPLNLFWACVDTALALPVFFLRLLILPMRFLFVWKRIRGAREVLVSSPVDFSLSLMAEHDEQLQQSSNRSLPREHGHHGETEEDRNRELRTGEVQHAEVDRDITDLSVYGTDFALKVSPGTSKLHITSNKTGYAGEAGRFASANSRSASSGVASGPTQNENHSRAASPFLRSVLNS